MRFFIGFALILVGITLVQSAPVIPQVNNFNAVVELLPQLQGFTNELDNIIAQLSNVLSPAQLQSLQEQFINAIVAALPALNADAIDKREVHDDYFELVNPFPTENVDDVLAVLPQLSGLINPINNALAQLAGFLSPTQIKALQQQALQLTLSLASGNININTFKDRFQALLQQYLGSNGKSQIDIDNIIQQIILTDPGGLPNFMSGLFGKRDVTDDRTGH